MSSIIEVEKPQGPFFPTKTHQEALTRENMDVLIISSNRANVPAPVLPAGPCLVAEAAERAGHSVILLDLMFEPDPVWAVTRHLRKERYDLIGLSVRNIDNNDMEQTKFYIRELLPLVSAIRRHSDAPLVLGGASLTVMPAEILRAVESPFAVIGDGEATFVRMLDRMSRSESCDDLPGVATLREGGFRANPAPVTGSLDCRVPAYDRWIDLRAYRSQLATLPLQTKLGCQFQCVYCTYRKIEGGTYRVCEPAAVAEAASRASSAGLFDIEFVDNVFNAPRDHALGVCESLIRAGVRARLQSVELNPAFLDGELIRAMERAGFTGVGITAESASDAVLERLRKGFTAREVHRAAECMHGRNLPCVWIFLLGGPGETEDSVEETLRFAGRYVRPGDAAFFNIGVRIYPGTELEEIARKEGVLTASTEAMLEPVFYVSPGIDRARLRHAVQKALSENMNFISVASFSLPYLPFINTLARHMGVKMPLWHYTRFIRKGLRFLGMDA